MLCYLSVLLYISDWSLVKAGVLFTALKGNLVVGLILFLVGAIFSSIILKTLFNKYRNHSNIKAYKESIEIPEELKEI